MIERDKEYYNQKISELYSIIENQEKIIRDLQEEVKGYQTMYFDKVMMVNKAIEYIENESRCTDYSGEPYYYLDEDELNELLEILKGVNND